MGEFPIEIVISLIGLGVAVAAFLREFIFVERKRLGYRVQMNTPASKILTESNGTAASSSPDDATPATSKSVVLIRIENFGSAVIEGGESGDYGTDDRPRLAFRDHIVHVVEVTERVNRAGEPVAALGAELRAITASVDTDGRAVIELPRERLAPGEHYKVLAVLVGPAPDPKDHNGEKVVEKRGSVKGGEFESTSSHSTGAGRAPALLALSGFLALVVMIQLLVAVLRPDPSPKDCAAGQLTLVGSTAMAPMIRSAAQSYEKACSGARFEFDFKGTTDGHDKLAEPAPAPDMVSIGEGPKLDTYPTLSEQAIAVAAYSVVLHRGLRVETLTVQQVQDLYAGRVVNWSEVGGPDLPVTLVDRRVGSGTKNTFDWRLGIAGRRSEATISCLGMPSDLRHCRVGSAEEMIDVVARTPGAIGYSETVAVPEDVRAIELGGVPATRENVLSHAYPFYSVEYALTDYPDGRIPADSLAANFIDYLVNGRGKLIVEEFGAAVCVKLPNPKTCVP